MKFFKWLKKVQVQAAMTDQQAKLLEAWNKLSIMLYGNLAFNQTHCELIDDILSSPMGMRESLDFLHRLEAVRNFLLVVRETDDEMAQAWELYRELLIKTIVFAKSFTDFSLEKEVMRLVYRAEDGSLSQRLLISE